MRGAYNLGVSFLLASDALGVGIAAIGAICLFLALIALTSALRRRAEADRANRLAAQLERMRIEITAREGAAAPSVGPKSTASDGKMLTSSSLPTLPPTIFERRSAPSQIWPSGSRKIRGRTSPSSPVNTSHCCDHAFLAFSAS